MGLTALVGTLRSIFMPDCVFTTLRVVLETVVDVDPTIETILEDEALVTTPADGMVRIPAPVVTIMIDLLICQLLSLFVGNNKCRLARDV